MVVMIQMVEIIREVLITWLLKNGLKKDVGVEMRDRIKMDIINVIW